MPYNGSDYTIRDDCDRYHVLTKRRILLLKLTLIVGGGDMSAFVSPLAVIARALHLLPVAVPSLGKAHKDSDHTAVITVVH